MRLVRRTVSATAAGLADSQSNIDIIAGQGGSAAAAAATDRERKKKRRKKKVDLRVEEALQESLPESTDETSRPRQHGRQDLAILGSGWA